MLWKLRPISRYRPRVLTVAVFLIVAALLVLANLTDELRERTYPTFQPESNAPSSDFEFEVGQPNSQSGLGVWGLSYGWPLLWGQYVISVPYGAHVVGWRYSVGRLAVDVALWLLLLMAPAAASEWVSRRYRLGFRFSLRMMLAAVTLAAAFLGWFVWARDRANVEDSIIDDLQVTNGGAWLDRWGPQWLDLFGADCYRRRIVAANVRAVDVEPDDGGNLQRTPNELLARLARLRSLEYLYLDDCDLTPEVAAAVSFFPRLRSLRITCSTVHAGAMEALAESLGRMPRLRVLSISLRYAYIEDGEEENAAEQKRSPPGGNPQRHRSIDFPERPSPNKTAGQLEPEPATQLTREERESRLCLTAISNAPQIEHLQLIGLRIGGGSLSRLAPLTNLKSLSLGGLHAGRKEGNGAPPLSGLPVFQSLAAVELVSDGFDLESEEIDDDDLSYLALLPRLKSLRLQNTRVTGAGIAKLTRLDSLEELSLWGPVVSSAGIEALIEIKGLKKLHLDGEYRQPLRPNGPRELVPDVGPADFDRSVKALRAVRQTHPEIIIDASPIAPSWDERRFMPRITTHAIATQPSQCARWFANGSKMEAPHFAIQGSEHPGGRIRYCMLADVASRLVP